MLNFELEKKFSGILFKWTHLDSDPPDLWISTYFSKVFSTQILTWIIFLIVPTRDGKFSSMFSHILPTTVLQFFRKIGLSSAAFAKVTLGGFSF